MPVVVSDTELIELLDLLRVARYALAELAQTCCRMLPDDPRAMALYDHAARADDWTQRLDRALGELDSAQLAAMVPTMEEV